MLPFDLPPPPGERPLGDPAAMRELAAELRAAAGRAGRLAAARTPTWRGRSATAFEACLARQQVAADSTADHLDGTARLLENLAEDLAREQREWQRNRDAYDQAAAREEMVRRELGR